MDRAAASGAAGAGSNPAGRVLKIYWTRLITDVKIQT